MKKISIIMPVYNVEPYIRKCLDSVVNQTYVNLEIICVDDGSSDASGLICDEYARQDSRIKVIHKSNGGYPSALNTGLDQLSGEYVGFVDPDDWIELDFYENACRAIVNEEVDFVCTGFSKDTSESRAIITNNKPLQKGKINRDQILYYTFIRDDYPAFGAYLWNKLFRSDFFAAGNKGGYQLRLSEDMKVGCDVYMFAQCALKATSAVYLDKPYYHYFQRETSLFHSKDINKRIGSLKAYAGVLELLKRHDVDSDIHIWVKRFYAYHASLLAEVSLANEDAANLELMQSEMKRYLSEYVDTNQAYPGRIERFHSLLGAIL